MHMHTSTPHMFFFPFSREIYVNWLLMCFKQTSRRVKKMHVLLCSPAGRSLFSSIESTPWAYREHRMYTCKNDWALEIFSCQCIILWGNYCGAEHPLWLWSFIRDHRLTRVKDDLWPFLTFGLFLTLFSLQVFHWGRKNTTYYSFHSCTCFSMCLVSTCSSLWHVVQMISCNLTNTCPN